MVGWAGFDDSGGMPYESTTPVGRGTAITGGVRWARETARPILATAAPTLLVAGVAGFLLATGIETGWNYDSTEASWMLLGLVPCVLIITITGTALSYPVCAPTRRTDSLPRGTAIRRSLLYAALVGVLCPELMLLTLELLEELWGF